MYLLGGPAPYWRAWAFDGASNRDVGYQQLVEDVSHADDLQTYVPEALRIFDEQYAAVVRDSGPNR